MKLTDKQQTFTLLVAHMVLFAYRELGARLTYGEAYRPPETATLYAKQGRGISKSLHSLRLAVDFNLFKGSKYFTKTEDYRPLGEHWESLSTPGIKCCWGGRFGDGNHFSIEHNGIK